MSVSDAAECMSRGLVCKDTCEKSFPLQCQAHQRRVCQTNCALMSDSCMKHDGFSINEPGSDIYSSHSNCLSKCQLAYGNAKNNCSITYKQLTDPLKYKKCLAKATTDKNKCLAACTTSKMLPLGPSDPSMALLPPGMHNITPPKVPLFPSSKSGSYTPAEEVGMGLGVLLVVGLLIGGAYYVMRRRSA